MRAWGVGCIAAYALTGRATVGIRVEVRVGVKGLGGGGCVGVGVRDRAKGDYELGSRHRKLVPLSTHLPAPLGTKSGNGPKKLLEPRNLSGE